MIAAAPFATAFCSSSAQNAYNSALQNLGPQQYSGLGSACAAGGLGIATYYPGGGSPSASTFVPSKPDKELEVNSETIPDVSITRVFKWALVLLVAMALGKKVWGLFGDKLTAQLHKAIGDDSAAK